MNRHLAGVSFRDPYSKHEWTLRGNDILVRGTPGAGDFMFSMSTAFYVANLLDIKIHLIFHWDHDILYEYHFEDPESIFEKIEYVHSMCYKPHLVTYEHRFDHDLDFGLQLFSNLHRRNWKEDDLIVPKGLNSWKFNDDLMGIPTVDNKVTVWRPKFNAEPAASWKRSYSDEDWELAIESLKGQGWSVVDLCYRTPIRDVLYHMQTARFTMGYDGMWHYFARMLYKPTACVGDSKIVNVHDPQAYPLMSPKKDKNRSFTMQSLVDHLDKSIPKLDLNISKYKRQVDHIIENR